MRQAIWPIGRRLFLIAAPILLASLPSRPLAGQEPAPPADRISVDVSVVQLHAVIRGAHGRPVSGLTPNDIQVFEDGVPQKIRYFEQQDIPVTAGIVIDHSGSMKAKMTDVISAARAFASASNPQDQMFVINFNERVAFGLDRDVPFTSDPAALENAISRFPTTGQTALYDAVIAGIDHLATGKQKEKVLLVISDGGDNASSHHLADLMDLMKKSDAIVYCIGLFDPNDPHPKPGLLKKLARSTGGEAYFPTETRDVVSICERIAEDIRAQYTIGYVPANGRRDGTYRTVQVVARSPKRGKLDVRTRAGYYATPKEDAKSNVSPP